MLDSESIKKLLRSVLQSSKAGVSLNTLQSEYRTLCGENIPLKKLGFSKLEDYLRSIPSVVRLEQHMGEMKCFAEVCQDTAHIAELVARQKSSKKSGRSQVINSRMRFKLPIYPYMLNVRPRSSLRQPSAHGVSNRSRPYGGFSASGDYRQLDQRLSSVTPVQHRQRPVEQTVKKCVLPDRNNNKKAEDCSEQASGDKLPQSSSYDVKLMERRISQLLEKYSSGLWMSKVPGLYCEMFGQELQPQVLTDMRKWTHVCMVEKMSTNNCSDCLLYPPLPAKSVTILRNMTNIPPEQPTESSFVPAATVPPPSKPSTPYPKSRVFSKRPLAKPTFVYPPPADEPASPPQGRPRVSHSVNGGQSELASVAADHNPTVHPLAQKVTHPAPTTTSASAPSVRPASDILPPLKVDAPPSSDSAAACHSSKSSDAAVLSEDVRQKIQELLSKYSQGLWAHALSKLFVDTYKTPFPEHLLSDLSLLLDICTVEYPVSHDKTKAILYNVNRADSEAADSQRSQESRSYPLPSGVEVVSAVVPASLVPPSEQYPSVLVAAAKTSNTVTVRYVGGAYSNAQEAMEDAMHAFYSQCSVSTPPVSNPVVGQLVAVRGEDGDELVRGQVTEVIAPNRVKVYYLDHGFSVETAATNVLDLSQKFLSLPFQAISVQLAGLQAFSSHPSLLSALDKLAVGKILLMETLEPCQANEMPETVLYDTSQDDDVNVNSACLKALQDDTMNNPLIVNATYEKVCVTNVCTDGSIYCQLPSRGTARLNKLLDETEAFFVSQTTSESLVSRPFSGKICLSRHKGKWSRVEITTLYGNIVMEVVFIDLGVQATVEVTVLREIPLPFLRDLLIIPPQAVRCRLADLSVPEGAWSPEVVLWVKEAVLSVDDCRMKILKLDQHKGENLVHVYLFIGAGSQEPDRSINHQLSQSQMWQKLSAQSFKNTTCVSSLESGRGILEKSTTGYSRQSSPALHAADESTTSSTLMPPPLQLPQPGENLDVFVPVACHPGYFVLQPWQDLHKLVVLMGEMVLYYNQMCKPTAGADIQKGRLYAAQIDKNWHRVLLKAILVNGLVSVYELDHGKHELVHSSSLRPLIEEFRHLPFQAITAQLAGVRDCHWSEEASMLFRAHVEKKALVAQVESVQEVSGVHGEVQERRLKVYLVDTESKDKDLWIHSIMANISSELPSAS